MADTLLQALRIRLWQRHYEDLLGRQQLFRRSILLADQRLDSGVFAGRTHRLLSFSGDGDFATLAVVHLASGQRRDVILSPTYLDYGLWNLVDWERRLVFHHGLGLDPAHYEYGKPLVVGPWGKVRTLQSDLIAIPIVLDK